MLDTDQHVQESALERIQRVIARLPGERVSRADLILCGVPFLFVGTYAAASWAMETWVLAAALAAVVSYVLIVDGLFWHPPTTSHRTSREHE